MTQLLGIYQKVKKDERMKERKGEKERHKGDGGGKGGSTNLKRYTCPIVHSSIMYNRQDMEATQVSTNI